MAVVIRFARHGTKGKPFYRIVAADKQYPRDGRYLEVLGTFNPKSEEAKLNSERVKYWIDNGAKPSPAVKTLIARGNAVA